MLRLKSQSRPRVLVALDEASSLCLPAWVLMQPPQDSGPSTPPLSFLETDAP